MSRNMVYSDIPSTRRVIPVPTQTPAGKAILHGGKAHVTLTGSGDLTKVTALPNGIQVTRVGGGVGLGALQATAAVTGSFAFDVTGATSGAATPGTAVYITPGGVLTLTASGNTAFGIVDFFRGTKSATDTVVKIGV